MEDYFKQRFRLKNRSHLVEAKLLFYIGEYKTHARVTKIHFLKNMQASSSVQHRLPRDPTGSCLYRERATFIRMYDLHNGQWFAVLVDSLNLEQSTRVGGYFPGWQEGGLEFASSSSLHSNASLIRAGCSPLTPCRPRNRGNVTTLADGTEETTILDDDTPEFLLSRSRKLQYVAKLSRK